MGVHKGASLQFCLSLAGCLCLPALALAQSEPKSCEFHVWPTAAYGAVFFGTTGFRIEGNAQVFEMQVQAREAATRKMQMAFPISDQISAIESVFKQSAFANSFNIIVHEPPKDSKYKLWYDKSVGWGSRDTDSNSMCYYELHIEFITIEKTALRKKFEIGFVYRKFGSESIAVDVVHDAKVLALGSFDFQNPNLEPGDRAVIMEPFGRSIAKFLSRKDLLLLKR